MNRQLRKNSYFIINLVFIGIILLIILYSFVFTPAGNYPVPSGAEFLSGTPVISTGLSRSFSAIVRFRFAEARQYNPNGIRIFLFFLIQLIMRITAGVSIFRTGSTYRPFIMTDEVLTVIIFVICFWPFIVNFFNQFI